MAQSIESGDTRARRASAWFDELTTTERRTFWACFAGWALDAMDVQLYSFAIPTLIALWSLTHGEAGIIATVALLVSALGGWIAGILADRFGRVRILQLSILWFSAFTFLSGLTNSAGELLVVRGLQGLGFGGEWAVGAVLMSEIVRSEHRGKAVGTVHSGWAVGWGAAALLYTALFSFLPETMAWRVLFFIGLLPGLWVFYIRRNVAEPTLFTESRGKAKSSVLQIFSRPLISTTLLCCLLAMGCQGGFYGMMIWLPTYLKTVRGLSVLNTGGYLGVIIVSSFVGYITSAYWCDMLGRRRNFMLFSVGSLLTVLIYTWIPISNGLMLVLGVPLGFFSCGIYSGVGAFFGELYPTLCRASAVGFCFSFGRSVGALFPALVGFLSASIPLAHAIGIFTALAYLSVIVAAVALPETRGKELTA
jgi:MFS family permease